MKRKRKNMGLYIGIRKEDVKSQICRKRGRGSNKSMKRKGKNMGYDEKRRCKVANLSRGGKTEYEEDETKYEVRRRKERTWDCILR